MSRASPTRTAHEVRGRATRTRDATSVLIDRRTADVSSDDTDLQVAKHRGRARAANGKRAARSTATRQACGVRLPSLSPLGLFSSSSFTHCHGARDDKSHSLPSPRLRRSASQSRDVPVTVFTAKRHDARHPGVRCLVFPSLLAIQNSEFIHIDMLGAFGIGAAARSFQISTR